MSCNGSINISHYMKYLRDIELSDTDAKELLQDVVYEIAFDTKIFKDTFAFDIEKCDEIYDIKALYGISQSMKYEIDTVEETDYTTEDLLYILQGKDLPPKDADEKCYVSDDGSDESSSQANTNCLNTYLNVIDIIYFDKNNHKYPLKSVINDWFDPVNDTMYEIRSDNVTRDTGIAMQDVTLAKPVTVIATVSIVPNIERLSTDDENLIRQALIAGLKYKASDMYLNAPNEQVSNLLYQRYYSAKKQLAFNFTQFTSHQRIKNPNWNY